MIRCANCRTVWLGTPDDEAILDDFLAHPCQTIAATFPIVAAAPLPTTHGMRSVERGTFASPADGLDPARHPSAGRRTLRGGVA